jgi:chromosome partitioning protein
MPCCASLSLGRKRKGTLRQYKGSIPMAMKPNTAKKKQPIVVAVLNMKGGVGKTTISAHVFRHLYKHLLKSVLLVDFDPQFNLTQTIVPQDSYEIYKSERKTILSVMEDQTAPSIFKVSSKLAPPPTPDDVSVQIRHLTHKPEIRLRLVPGDFDLIKYSLNNDSKVLEPVKNRFLAFMDTASTEFDLVCIDCNPSSSFMTVCALQAATHVLVPVRADRYSLLGLKMLDQYIKGLPQIANKPELVVILNGVKNKYDPSVENTLRSDPQFGPATLVNSLHESTLLSSNPGYIGFATDNRQNWRVTPRITAIVDEIGKKTGLV